jgi:hypothetical protein
MAKTRAPSNPFAKIFGSLSAKTVPDTAPTTEKTAVPSTTSPDSSSSKVAPAGESHTIGGTKTASDGNLQTVVSGDALAAGTDTTTSGTIYSRSFDKGPVQISFGYTKFAATAQSPAGDTPYADANTSVQNNNADISMDLTHVSSGSGSTSSGGSYATDASRTLYFAINIEGVDLPRGPVHLSHTVESPNYLKPTPIGGNIATFDADAQAHGNGSLVDVQYDALTVSNTVSAVSGVVVTEVA